MKKEILDDPAFIEKIAPEFICVLIDFPQHQALSKEQQEKNQILKERLEISEFPRLILLDPSEREITRLGYSPEKGEKFGQDLLHIVGKDRHLTSVMKELTNSRIVPADLRSYYLEAQELHRKKDAARLLDVGLTSNEPLFFLLEKYRLLVEEGKGQEKEAIACYKQLVLADPDNSYGVQFALALIHFQQLANNETTNTNPKEVIKPLEDYLRLYGESDKENIWRVEMMIAQFYLDADESKTALKHAQIAYDAAPLDKKQEISDSINYINSQTSCIVEGSK